MHYILTVDQILSRAVKIGLGEEDLCAEAGIARSTLVRGKKNGNCRVNTLRAMCRVLEQHERERLDHLRKLYPEEQAA